MFASRAVLVPCLRRFCYIYNLVAVSAASALFRVLLVVVSASAFAFATTFILASAAVATATASVHMVEQSLDASRELILTGASDKLVKLG